MKKIILILFLISLYSCVNEKQVGKRWSKEKAWNWYNQNTVMPANTKDLVISPGAIVTLTNVPLYSFGYR